MNMSDQSLPSLNDDPTLRTYRAAVRDWHGYMRFLGFASIQDNEDVPIDNLFVPPELAESAISPDAEPSSWARRTVFSDCLEPGRPLVVLGDPGSGKSTLVNWLTWRLASGLTRSIGHGLDGCLPVPMILREMQLGELNTFDDLLSAFFARPVAEAFKRDASLIRQFAAAGKVLFLLDGIDELSSSTSQRLRKVLSDLPSEFSGCFWLLTSRIVGYEEFLSAEISISKSEIDAIAARDSSDIYAGRPTGIWVNLTGATRPGWLNPFLYGKYDAPAHKTLYVAPFDDRRIEEFANAWYRLRDNAKTRAEATAKDFLAAIRRDVGITRLARTPNLLTLMALVFRVKAQLPDGRGMLYDDISQAYLESIDRARGGVSIFLARDGGTENKEPPWREKKRWLARVGFEMQLRRANKSDSVHVFEGTRRQLLFSTKEVCGWLTTAMDVSGYGGGQDAAEAFLKWAARRSGLLVPRGEGLHAFMHLTFQEYFAAAFIVEEFKSPDWSSASKSAKALRANYLHPEIARDNLTAWAGEAVWEEVLVLAFEQLAHDPRWAERLLKFVLPATITQGTLQLATRLLINPHSGLPQKTKEFLRQSVHSRINEGQSSGAYRSQVPSAMLRIWSDRAEREAWLAVFARSKPTKLVLDGCEAEELDFLKHLGSLEELSITAPASGKFEALQALPALFRLSLRNLQANGFRDLGPLPNLGAFWLEHSHLYSLDGIENLKGAELVSFWDCHFENLDLTPLKNTRVQDVSFANSTARDVANLPTDPIPIRSLTIQEYFRQPGSKSRLQGSNFALYLLEKFDTEALNLTGVWIDFTEDFVRIVSKHRRLTQLRLEGGGWTSLEFVRELPELRVLNVERTNIKNFDALEGLTKLEVWVSAGARAKTKFPWGRSPKMHYVKNDIFLRTF